MASYVIASARLVRSEQRPDRKQCTLLLLQSDRYSRIAIPGGSRGRLLIEPPGGEILARKLPAETLLFCVTIPARLLLEVRRAAGEEDARKL